jgi:hypothetical protein
MSGGIINSVHLENCECGEQPIMVWHFVKGVANKVHYFVKCPNCRKRTVDRKNIKGASEAWQIKQYRK